VALAGRGHRLAQRGAQRVEEAALGGLDGGALELHDGRSPRSGASGHCTHEGRLSHPGNPVDHRDERTVLIDQPEHLGELSVTADERARPLVEYVPQGPGHVSYALAVTIGSEVIRVGASITSNCRERRFASAGFSTAAR
jgi:hypothetical protein